MLHNYILNISILALASHVTQNQTAKLNLSLNGSIVEDEQVVIKEGGTWRVWRKMDSIFSFSSSQKLTCALIKSQLDSMWTNASFGIRINFGELRLKKAELTK